MRSVKPPNKLTHSILLHMKLATLFVFIVIIPFSLHSQSHQHLEPGAWGGTLLYQGQSTEFYLDFRLDENGDVTAYSYMPVLPFPERSLGAVSRADTLFTAGPIRFVQDSIGQTLIGSYPNSPRGLRFELSPIDTFPTVKEPVSSLSTAAPAWTFNTGGAIWGDAATGKNQVYIGSSNGNLYSLSQTTGELKWKHQTNGAIFSRPLVSNHHVYTLSDDGLLYKLDAETGSPIWTFDTGGKNWQCKLPDDETPGYDSQASAAVISDEIVYVGSANGHLYAIDKNTGTEIWRFKTGGPIHSIPVLAEGLVYFGSYDHHVYAVHAQTGKMDWKFDTGQIVVSSPVLANGLVIIGSRSADLYALNAYNGQEEWRYYHWGSWVESSGTVFDDLLYIGSSDDQLLKSFNPENGNLLWISNLGGSPWSTPAVTENTVYTGTFGNTNYAIEHRGGFFAVDRLTGKEKWRFRWEKEPGSAIYGVVSSPAAANNMVFFGGLDGVVYGFHQDY